MFLPKAHSKDAVARTPAPKYGEAFKFYEAARKNIPIAEIGDDAVVTLDCGIFCLFPTSSRVGAGDAANGVS